MTEIVPIQMGDIVRYCWDVNGEQVPSPIVGKVTYRDNADLDDRFLVMAITMDDCWQIDFSNREVDWLVTERENGEKWLTLVGVEHLFVDTVVGKRGYVVCTADYYQDLYAAWLETSDKGAKND